MVGWEFLTRAPHDPEVGKEALDRFGALHAIEATAKGLPPAERCRQRQAQTKPIAETRKFRSEEISRQLSERSEFAGAVRYMLACWRVGSR